MIDIAEPFSPLWHQQCLKRFFSLLLINQLEKSHKIFSLYLIKGNSRGVRWNFCRSIKSTTPTITSALIIATKLISICPIAITEKHWTKQLFQCEKINSFNKIIVHVDKRGELHCIGRRFENNKILFFYHSNATEYDIVHIKWNYTPSVIILEAISLIP